ncbi:MAG: DUF4124 domain-containing protein [Halioglobus sp.]
MGIKRMLLVAALVAVPQVATAKVYMCTDPATGKTSFTDKACDTQGTREEVRVKAANLESGSRYKKGSAKKTWNSERDQRKTGLDYNAERRALYGADATASTN